MDIMAQVQEWAKQTFWRKRDHVAASTGTQDAGLPVVLNSLGKLAVSLLTPIVGNLVIDGYTRVRDVANSRYRSDRIVSSGITTINSYDDTEEVYRPLNIDASILALNANFSAWTNLTLGTGWANFGAGYQGAQYRKIGDMVYLRGLVTRTSGVGTTITTLPSLHRPVANMLFDVQSNDALGRLDISTVGVVTLTTGSGVWVNLSDIPPFSTI